MAKPSFSRISPHLCHSNYDPNHASECSNAVVVPWAEKLWTITYPGHMPRGSVDKLRSIDAELNVIEHEESVGGPKDSTVTANVPSDPYLMTGYGKKSVELTADKDCDITLEVDIDGTGIWGPYKTFTLPANKTVNHSFPEGFSGYWVRTTTNNACIATAWFEYK